MVNWDSILLDIKQKTGKTNKVDPAIWNLETPGYGEILQLWQKNNVNTDSIEWINYYPTINYSKDIEIEFANSFNCTPLRSWISRIDPGYMTGWHWDVDDHESEYKSKGKLVRYTCFIDKPKVGHAFVIGQQCYYNVLQGTTVKWNKYNEWHCGMNGGLEPNFMFHLIGYI